MGTFRHMGLRLKPCVGVYIHAKEFLWSGAGKGKVYDDRVRLAKT